MAWKRGTSAAGLSCFSLTYNNSVYIYENISIRSTNKPLSWKDFATSHEKGVADWIGGKFFFL